MDKTVYIVHCVDTEGPLYEPLSATQDRIKQTFGLDYDLTPSLLEQLRQGRGIPEDLRESVMGFVSPLRLSYKRTWDEIDEMLDELLSSSWRDRYVDDFGRPYRFNWFILDHVGFDTNPRRRALGYHVVLEHYLEKLRGTAGGRDAIYWHFHPVPFSRAANRTSNNFSYTSEHLQVLSRRVIDHLRFPAAFRPGSHTERADINLFLEMWIPFDYGNQGMPEREEDALQKDLGGGRFGDWRRATSEWEVYNPDFYDYQKKGEMKRYVARCLNIGSRVRPITSEEVGKAFSRAATGAATILSVTNHDEREMRSDIDDFMGMVQAERRKYPEVRIRHANAVDAIRQVCRLKTRPPVQLAFSWRQNRLEIQADGPTWGPQPYFCFQTLDARYIHENLDDQGGNVWTFTFDQETIELEQLSSIGLATNDEFGNTSVFRLTPDQDLSRTAERFLNKPEYTE